MPFHIIKAIILAVMMFLSLQFLGFSVAGSAIFSLVPLLLGLLNVFTGFAYGLTGLIFIAACATALIPDWRTKSQEIWQAAKKEVASAQHHDGKQKAGKGERIGNETKK